DFVLPTLGIKGAPQVRRKRAFTDAELATFVRWLPQSPYSRTVRDALTLVLLTGCRASGVTPRELADAGIHRQVLSRLVADRRIERVARGLYRLAEQPITENHGLAVAATAVPQGVICLLSALQYHGIGTQLPPKSG